MLLIYYSLIYPNLICCQTVWGAASRESLRPLITIQKRAIRTIAGLRGRDHTNDVFHKPNILKLTDINTLTCTTYVYKCLHDLTFSNNDFTSNVNNHY